METPVQTDSTVRQARLAALVILVTFPSWLGFSYLGGQMGWDPAYAILGDLMALAAFIWALVVLYQVWRKRQRDEE